MAAELKEELKKLSFEVRDLSKEIGTLKSMKNKTESKEERFKLKQAIKHKQYQALFYIEKIENLSKELDRRG
jgi:hypothetical protein